MKHVLWTALAVTLLGSGAAVATSTPEPTIIGEYDLVEGLQRIPGTVSGFTGLRDRDDLLGGALVLPTLRPHELLQFQFESLLAPSEELTAGPLKFNVPGNLYIPSQKERYGILPITIAKEAFGFYGQPGRSEELMSISFVCKLSDLIKMAQDKAPFTKMIPLIGLSQYNLTAERDWTTQSKISVTLDKAYARRVGYRWSKSATPANAGDTILHFQQTPAKRWMITDIVGTPQAQGQLATAPSLGNAPTRAYFVRITDGAGQSIKSAEGYFLPSNGSAYNVQGFPAAISGGSVSGSRIKWDPITSPGWMAIIRNQKGTGLMPREIFPFGGAQLLGDDGVRDDRVLQRTQNLEGWVNAASGYYDMTAPLGTGESVILLFVGTSQEVPAPTAGEDEPALFTHATDIRFVTLP